jgi:guanylate kinase
MVGNLIIVSAPSGAGKTTLVSEVAKLDRQIKPSVSFTSRTPRAGEVDGVHYHFVTTGEFERMVERGEFLEWAQVHGNLYGTSRQVVEGIRNTGFDCILTIDVQGAAQARAFYPEAVGVFILPPSYQALVERLDTRGTDSSNDLKVRMHSALVELSHYRSFDYLLINEDLVRARDELAAIIIAERCLREKRAALAEEILITFRG